MCVRDRCSVMYRQPGSEAAQGSAYLFFLYTDKCTMYISALGEMLLLGCKATPAPFSGQAALLLSRDMAAEGRVYKVAGGAPGQRVLQHLTGCWLRHGE